MWEEQEESSYDWEACGRNKKTITRGGNKRDKRMRGCKEEENRLIGCDQIKTRRPEGAGADPMRPRSGCGCGYGCGDPRAELDDESEWRKCGYGKEYGNLSRTSGIGRR